MLDRGADHRGTGCLGQRGEFREGIRGVPGCGGIVVINGDEISALWRGALINELSRKRGTSTRCVTRVVVATQGQGHFRCYAHCTALFHKDANGKEPGGARSAEGAMNRTNTNR